MHVFNENIEVSTGKENFITVPALLLFGPNQMFWHFKIKVQKTKAPWIPLTPHRTVHMTGELGGENHPSPLQVNCAVPWLCSSACPAGRSQVSGRHFALMLLHRCGFPRGWPPQPVPPSTHPSASSAENTASPFPSSAHRCCSCGRKLGRGWTQLIKGTGSKSSLCV